MDFSKVTSLTIPEGNVVEIKDASGRVLWKAGPSVFTVIKTGTGRNAPYINGKQYTGNAEVQVDKGAPVVVSAYGTAAGIYWNGTLVAYGTYMFTVSSNLLISYTYDSANVRDIVYITEIPEGQIPFTIEGTNYFADEGMTWAEWVDSDYNTANYFVSGNYVHSYATIRVFYDTSPVLKTDEIIKGHVYNHVGGGSGGSND